MSILFFESVSYCSMRNIITSDFSNTKHNESRYEISATMIRNLIRHYQDIPSYLLQSYLSELLKKAYENNSENIFC